MEYFQALNLLQIAATLGAAGLVMFYRRRIQIDRGSAVWCLAAMIAFATVPYWGLGPFSFAIRASELDFAFTTYWLEITRPAAVKFLHGFAGGNDAYSLGVASGQYLSLERFLLWAFPLWIAHAIHKILVCSVVAIGSYLLVRAERGNRLVAIAIAGIAIYGWGLLSPVTWIHGLGPNLAPLLAYLFAYRYGRRHYFAGVLAGSVLFAVSSSFPHSLLFVAPAILAAGALRGWRPLLRGALPALVVLVAFVLLNWHETLYAMASLAPYTHRGGLALDNRSFAVIVEDWFGRLTPVHESVFAALIALAVLAVRRSPRVWLAALLFVAVLVGGPILQQLPFEDIGLGPLRGFQFVYLILAMPAIAVLLVAVAAGPADQSALRALPRPVWFLTAALLALSCGKLAYAKGYEVSQWLVEGNLRMYTGNDDIHARTWGSAEPFRVVSVPYRLPITFPPIAGLDTIDGVINLIPNSVAMYWQHGINVGETWVKGGHLTLFDIRRDEKCCERYLFDDYVNVALLRAANVAFVLSRLPLYGADLKQVAGPANGAVPPRNSSSVSDKIRGYLHLNFNADPIYVYALNDPLPRLYAARAVRPVDDGVGEKAFHGIVAENAPGRTIVIRRADNRFAEGDIAQAAVKTFALETNGVRAELDAPMGGIVVANIPYTPFWTAYADGRPLPVVPVNGIQMAAEVPPGSRTVEFRYERPLLREKIRALVGGKPK